MTSILQMCLDCRNWRRVHLVGQLDRYVGSLDLDVHLLHPSSFPCRLQSPGSPSVRSSIRCALFPLQLLHLDLVGGDDYVLGGLPGRNSGSLCLWERQCSSCRSSSGSFTTRQSWFLSSRSTWTRVVPQSFKALPRRRQRRMTTRRGGRRHLVVSSATSPSLHLFLLSSNTTTTCIIFNKLFAEAPHSPFPLRTFGHKGRLAGKAAVACTPPK